MGRPRGSKNKPKEQSATGGEPTVTETAPTPEQEDRSPAAPPAFRARSALIEEINNTNKEQAIADGEGEAVELEDTDETQPGATEVATGSETDEGAAEGDGSETPPDQEAAPEVKPAKKKLIIDGVEKELTEQEIIALAQKAGAVDSRLEQATRILEDAKRMAATQPGATRAATRETGAGSDQPSPPGDVDDPLVDEISNAVLYGDQEQVKTAIKRILGTGRQPATPAATITPQEIRRHVVETIDFESAVRLLNTPPEQGGFNDIYGDPMMRRMFEAREDELRKGNTEKGVAPDQRKYTELYKHIATELRDWRDGIVKAHTKPTGLENRDSLKRSTGVVLNGGGGRSPAAKPTPPVTHDSIVDSMRRSRGLN